MVFEAPFIVILPPEPVNVAAAFTVTFPVMITSAIEDTVPETIRLLKVIPVPEMVFEAPDIVTVPPLLCVKVPTPDVERLPDTDIVVAVAVIPEPLIDRLLKLCVPVPLMIAFVPLKVMVPVLPVNVPLLIKLPATVCENVPLLKVVPVPISTKPPKLILEAVVYVTELPVPIELVKLPAMVNADAGIVLVAAPVLLKKFKCP